MTVPTFETIRLDIVEGLAELTLNNPSAMNVLGYQLGADLKAATAAIQQDVTVRAVLLNATGEHFCGGGDLKAMRDGFDTDPKRFFEVALVDIHTAIKTLVSMTVPVVCAVQGYAAGAGANLALAADIIFVADTAVFYQAFTQVGVSIDSGGTYSLPRALGDKRAMYYLLTGKKLKAGEALAMGLVSKLVPKEDLDRESRALATQLAHGPTHAYRQIKRLVGQHQLGDFHAALDAELAAQIACGATMDFQIGVNSFLGKTLPDFTGS